MRGVMEQKLKGLFSSRFPRFPQIVHDSKQAITVSSTSRLLNFSIWTAWDQNANQGARKLSVSYVEALHAEGKSPQGRGGAGTSAVLWFWVSQWRAYCTGRIFGLSGIIVAEQLSISGEFDIVIDCPFAWFDQNSRAELKYSVFVRWVVFYIILQQFASIFTWRDEERWLQIALQFWTSQEKQKCDVSQRWNFAKMPLRQRTSHRISPRKKRFKFPRTDRDPRNKHPGIQLQVCPREPL